MIFCDFGLSVTSLIWIIRDHSKIGILILEWLCIDNPNKGGHRNPLVYFHIYKMSNNSWNIRRPS